MSSSSCRARAGAAGERGVAREGDQLGGANRVEGSKGACCRAQIPFRNAGLRTSLSGPCGPSREGSLA